MLDFSGIITEITGLRSLEQEIFPGFKATLPAIYEVRPAELDPSRSLVYVITANKNGSGICIDQVSMISADGTRINTNDWRAISPYEIWEYVGTKFLVEKAPANLILKPVEEVANLRSRGIRNDETLQYVATLYGLAESVQISPNKFVQNIFSVNGKLDPLPRPTASKWIKAAKEKGMLARENTLNGADNETIHERRRALVKQIAQSVSL